MPLPFLRLPHLAFESVYRHWGNLDLIMLSACSKRMRTIVRSMEKNRGQTLEVSVEKDHSFLKVMSMKKKPVFTWKICLGNSPYQNAEEWRIDISIEGRSWKIEEDESLYFDEWLCYSEPDHIDRDTLFFVRFFQEVFHCSIDEITVGVFRENSIETLFLGSSILHTAREIYIDLTKLSSSDVNFVFENLNTESLKFFGYSEELETYNYQKPVLRFPKIAIHLAQWITAAYFMEMAETCKEIILSTAFRITDHDYNRFLKTWLAGTNETLEKVEIRRDPIYCLKSRPKYVPFERDTIFDDLEYTVMGNEPHRPIPGLTRIEVKIKRSDGKLARVIVHENTLGDRGYGEFEFIVVK